MIYNRDNVPSAYSNKSRDYQVLLKLFDLITNFIKLDLDSLNSLISPDSCPDHMLPLLASYMEYEYDYNETYESNRIVMRYFPKLLRHKGNEIGIKSAMLLSCNISSENFPDLDKIIADYDYANATIYIYYPSYLNKIRDLIEVVRPAGMRIIMLTYDKIEAVEIIGIYDDVMIINQEDYQGTLKQYTSDSKSYFITDTEGQYIIGIGTDSRSVISDDYKKNGTIVLPSKDITMNYPTFKDEKDNPSRAKGSLTEYIDNNGYLRSIKPTSETYLNKPEFVGRDLVDGSSDNSDNIKTDLKLISRIGFSEIAGIRDKEGDEQ